MGIRKATGCSRARRPADRADAQSTSTSSPATAARSSWWCCPRPRSAAPSWRPSACTIDARRGALPPRRSPRRSAAATEEQASAGVAPGRDGSVTVSVGVAIFPDHGQTPDQLVANADKALYMAKRQGKNRVCLYEP